MASSNVYFRRASPSVVATARKDDPGPVEVATAGWTTFDLGAGFALAPAFSLPLTVLNVLDKEYTATPDPTAVAAPGRSAGLTLAGTFGAR